jgi:hypothetical protein
MLLQAARIKCRLALIPLGASFFPFVAASIQNKKCSDQEFIGNQIWFD